VPFGSGSATRRVALNRAAEAAGQRTARGRLQRRVGPPVQSPFVQNCTSRTISEALCIHTVHWSWGGGSDVETLSAAPLRAQSDLDLRQARRTRKRGARECRARGPFRARALTETTRGKRNSAHQKPSRTAGGKVQRQDPRLPLEMRQERKCAKRSGQLTFRHSQLHLELPPSLPVVARPSTAIDIYTRVAPRRNGRPKLPLVRAPHGLDLRDEISVRGIATLCDARLCLVVSWTSSGICARNVRSCSTIVSGSSAAGWRISLIKPHNRFLESPATRRRFGSIDGPIARTSGVSVNRLEEPRVDPRRPYRGAFNARGQGLLRRAECPPHHTTCIRYASAMASALECTSSFSNMLLM
jgi:hypothetical protein